MTPTDSPHGAPAEPQRILIVRLSHLGDIVQALPLYHALRERWPRAELGWAVQPEFAGLVAPLARVFPFRRRGGLGAWRSLGTELGAWGPDIIIDAQGNWKSAVAARLARRATAGARSVALPPGAWQEPFAARILRPECAPSGAEIHLVPRCVALAGWITGQGIDPRFDPDLTASERAGGEALLARHCTDDEPLVLHPGVAGDPRSWPQQSFAELARRLVRDGFGALILTGPGEERVGAELRDEVPTAAHLVGQRGLRQLAALLAAVHGRGGQIVVGDSGPAHMAASVGLPVVLLAGPEDPLRTGPWPTVAPAACAPDDRGSPHRLAAPPANFGQSRWTPRPMDAIRVDDVLLALKDRARPGGGSVGGSVGGPGG